MTDDLQDPLSEQGSDPSEPPRDRPAVVHVNLLARPSLSVDDPDAIDW